MAPFGIGRDRDRAPAPRARRPVTGPQPPPPGREPDAPGAPEAWSAPVQPPGPPPGEAGPEPPRVAVVSEPAGAAEDVEYRWHTGVERPTGRVDAIEFIDVHKAFGRNRILRGLNMGLPEGMISMILGPSGTGKSVCIKHMVGLLYPDQGDVLVHGESVPNMVDDDLFEMRKKFGVLFQDGALFGSMNLYDNVAFPLRQHTDKSEDAVAEIVNRRLSEVGLGDANDKMPNELSGGMRKRAGFARALVLDPDIVLFDEPDSGLDPVRTALLCELIQEVHNENGGAYVVITHDIASARRVAEHISVLWKGRIVESGPAEELFNSDNAFVRQFLSGESQGPLGME
jgi:phospholipid/cholesterol/gamma-HCH transport system ATP-binding protein